MILPSTQGPGAVSLIGSRGTVATVKNELGSNRFRRTQIGNHVRSRLGNTV